MDPEAFFAHQEKLVQEERDFELLEIQRIFEACTPAQLAKKGLALLGLTVVNIKTGAGGKSLVDLELSHATSTSPALPSHKMRVGDIVALEEHGTGSKGKPMKASWKPKLEGVVFRITETTIVVAIKSKKEGENEEEIPKEVQERCRLIKLANNVTYERMISQMKFLKDALSQVSTNSLPLPLINVLFGRQNPTFDDAWSDLQKIQFLDPMLNPSQQEAVRFALAAEQVALIHGPPGTGKTFTLVELVRQFVLQKKRVLVCGPSNISVDNLVERLSAYRLNIVRVGHPARVLPSVLDHSLDVLSRTSDQGRLVNDIRVELDETFQKIQKCKFRSERKQLFQEVKQLRKDFRTREKLVVKELVQGASVVLSTLNGCAAKPLWGEKFDIVIIDEATQALEAECWIAISKGAKVVLAGDHLQLPPTIISEGISLSSILAAETLSLTKELKLQRDRAVRVGASASFEVPALDIEKIAKDSDYSSFLLSTTMFARLLGCFPKDDSKLIKRTLVIQYRMHEDIMTFSSQKLYQNLLIADESCRKWLLKDLPEVKRLRVSSDEEKDTDHALVFLDTSMAGMPEETENQENSGATASSPSSGIDDSKLNRGEAATVVDYVRSLIHSGVSAKDIAIITPYSAQNALLRQLLRDDYPDIEIGTVDGFQGREKQAVILTLVRSNDSGDVGFLSDRRRLNVAMTRSKRQLCVVGDSETLGKKDAFLKAWMEFLSDHADVRYID
ncbi:P-loop containing nucleoside triphosphate hydrolase protein [Lobosporangium transversale]|uniref:DNA helicase n=1 Tax=Lobosporangium transversale TaxID=64571 RepID=A0A1Y2GMT4_9FUNG|nr:P-loop containing nucleoside triphosphate hydrolase protein [Lobosporangium transversale]ORZ15998.1 P-loop containing nucleoside triphosphate hydrolase protein [Lobosporangium transversale]|eukprot:XP_021881345.1 P-loop containing nucleoside triphosphate hydrolase protein [Lobosporangium transversale]